MKTFLSTLLAACLVFAGPAAVSSQTCEKGDIYVFFGNGVENSRLSALSSLATLQARVSPTVPDSLRSKLQFRLSYNADNFLFGDLIDAYGQWNNELEINFIRWVRGLGNPPPWFTNVYNSFIRAIDARRYIIDSDLRRHVEQYRELTDQGHKVVLVAHSQGNFYANAAHRIVNSRGFGMTAVATPAGIVEGGGQHTTLAGDLVIAVVLGALPPNVTNSSRGDWANHGFVTSYMNGDGSAPRIVSLVGGLVRSLPYPEVEVQTGIITVRLTWGSQPDVDLHVYEPGGAHVYYRNFRGAAGFLDVDDTSGFGPEHYYVSCSTLVEGTYRVGVNYYAGSAPEAAQIQVRAGTVSRNFSRALPAQRGTSGDQSPVPVANIVVTRADGAFKFEVVETVGQGAATSPSASPETSFKKTPERQLRSFQQ